MEKNKPLFAIPRPIPRNAVVPELLAPNAWPQNHIFRQ